MYNPATGKAHYQQRSWVTVSQAKNLVNQVVEVSWRGFTPSSSLIYDATSTDYPVMVAECKGLIRRSGASASAPATAAPPHSVPSGR